MPAAPIAQPLGKAAARGFSWLIAQTLGTKAINTGMNIILAWLLVREDFGLIGLAYTVTSLITVLRQAGLREVLIHRHAHFDRWANPVFWMSAWLGVAAMFLTWLAIPAAERLYGDPQLGGILAILSVNAFLGSLTVVPLAKLSNELRFHTMSIVVVMQAATQAIVACGLAWLGWGAYAIAVAAVAGMVCLVLLLWNRAPHWPKRSMQIRRWRFLFGDSATMFITGLIVVVIAQGDYIALGIFHTSAITGLYFFAFNLSMQTVTLFANNLGNVLFPTLAKLQNEPVRQANAFIRASRLLAFVAVPACFLQAALADPVFHLIFPATWYPAIPVMQILSIGMAWWAVGAPGRSFMQSQGRFRALLSLTVICGIVYLASVTGAAAWCGMVGVAVAEAIMYSLMGPAHAYFSILPGGGRWRSLIPVFGPSTAGAMIAIVPGVLIGHALPLMAGRDVLRIALILCLAGPIYVAFMRRMAPGDCRELWLPLGGVIRRIAGLRRDAPPPASDPLP